MLRENLDTVLKDLLEFKPDEKVHCTYPGPHLVLEDNFLVNENSFYNNNSAADRNDSCCNMSAFENAQMLNRIRRYLDRKLILSKMKSKFQKHLTYTNKIKKEKFKRHLPYLKIEVNNKINRRTDEIRFGRKLMMFKRRVKNMHDRKNTTTLHAHVTISTTSRSNTGITHAKQVTETKEMNSDPAKGDAALKARFLFKSCMNYEILEKRGHQPLLDLLDLLGGWPILNSSWVGTNFDWLELMAKLRLYNNDILISEWVGPDIKNSDEFVIQFDQTSLGKVVFYFLYFQYNFVYVYITILLFYCRVAH